MGLFEAAAITKVLTSLPLGHLALAVFAAVAVLLLATTYDSASYTLASVSTQRLEAGRNPARWNCVFWACCLGILPVTLMFIEGGIKVVLSATIVFSLPLIAIGVLDVHVADEDAARGHPHAPATCIGSWSGLMSMLPWSSGSASGSIQALRAIAGWCRTLQAVTWICRRPGRADWE